MAVPDVPLDGKDVRFTAGRARFSRDGSRLAVFGSCYRVWVWAVADGELLFEDRGDRTNLYSDVWPGDLSPDGRWLAYPSEDGTGVRLIDLSNPRPGTVRHDLRAPVAGYRRDLRAGRGDTWSPLRRRDRSGLGRRGVDSEAAFEAGRLSRGRSACGSCWPTRTPPRPGRRSRGLSAIRRPRRPCLASGLSPVAAPDPAEVRRLVAGLDSNTFADRDRAERALRAYREQAVPALSRSIEASDLRRTPGPA